MRSKKEFIRITSGIWKHLFTKTYIPQVIDRKNKHIFPNDLYEDVINYKYYPLPPRDYIISNKHNLVARIVPALEPRDLLVYYYCVKVLENDLSKNRIEGTFGGFSMGGELRRQENNELEEIDNIIGAVSHSPYPYNPLAWVNAWRDYQRTIVRYIQLTNSNKCFIIFDIANFYDSINLSILESKIRNVSDTNNKDEIDLLFFYLRNWNKRFESYKPKTVGIPQDEVGDPSRVLANFYLQDFDKKIFEEAKRKNVKYVRYADDMIIMGSDLEDLKSILFLASLELSKINLNINSSKVKIFESQKKFIEYLAINIFNLLAERDNKQNIERAIDIFFDYKERGIRFKEASVIKRFLSCDINKIDLSKRSRLYAYFLDDDFLSNAEEYHLRKIFNLLNKEDKQELIGKLNNLVDKVLFNKFHYVLLKVANDLKVDDLELDTKRIKNKIKELKYN